MDLLQNFKPGNFDCNYSVALGAIVMIVRSSECLLLFFRFTPQHISNSLKDRLANSIQYLNHKLPQMNWQFPPTKSLLKMDLGPKRVYAKLVMRGRKDDLKAKFNLLTLRQGQRLELPVV
jgi:hypothetical protein